MTATYIGPSYIAGRNRKWSIRFEKLTISYKIKDTDPVCTLYFYASVFTPKNNLFLSLQKELTIPRNFIIITEVCMSPKCPPRRECVNYSIATPGNWNQHWKTAQNWHGRWNTVSVDAYEVQEKRWLCSDREEKNDPSRRTVSLTRGLASVLKTFCLNRDVGYASRYIYESLSNWAFPFVLFTVYKSEYR